MSYGMNLLGSESRFHLSTEISNPPIRRSQPETRTHLFLKTHLNRPTISVQRHKTRTTKAAAISSFCETRQGAESFYELLGIPQGVTPKEIKVAYKQLARKYHPDVSPPDRVEEYTKRFIQVKEAYETLSNPRSRASYDRDLADGFDFNGSFSAQRRTTPFDQRVDGWGIWRDRWLSQLMELKQNSNSDDSRRPMTWGAQKRRQRSQSFNYGVVN